MSWSHIQSANTPSSGSAASAATAFGAATAVGHLVVVNVCGNASSVTLTDSAGNTWMPLTPYDGIFPFYSVITNPGTLTITATPNTSSFLDIEAAEFAGNKPALAGSPQDATGTGTTASAGSLTYSGNALVVGSTVLTSSGGTATAGSGYALDSTTDFSNGVHFGQQVVYKLNDSSGSSTPSVGYASSCSWSMVGYAFVEGVSRATLSGPTSGAEGAQSTAFTVTLDVAAPSGGAVVTPSSTGSRDTFQASLGGGNVTTITIAQGQTTGTFYLTPGSTSWRSVSISTSPSLTYPGSPATYFSGTARNYFSTVSGFAAGLSTVGYMVLGSDGTTKATRATSGVVSLGNGGYGALVPLPFSGAYAIRWDDGGSPANYAFDTLVPLVIDTDGLELGQLMGLLRAYVAGKTTGFGSSGATSGKFLGADGSTTRISGPCDQYGNRSSPTINPLV
jgi:hypothetical protein